MRIHRKDVGEVTVLELSGNFAGGPDSDRFERAVEELVHEKRWTTVLRFRDVKWINSPGIGILARNYSHYVRFGGRMVVAELNERISVLFDMMIRNIFETYATVDEAVAALQDEEARATH